MNDELTLELPDHYRYWCDAARQWDVLAERSQGTADRCRRSRLGSMLFAAVFLCFAAANHEVVTLVLLGAVGAVGMCWFAAGFHQLHVQCSWSAEHCRSVADACRWFANTYDSSKLDACFERAKRLKAKGW